MHAILPIRRPRPVRFSPLLAVVASLSTTALAAPSDWTVKTIASDGVDGFTSIFEQATSAGGQVILSGVRDGQEGIFMIVGPVITTLVTDGMELPGQLGTIDTIGGSTSIDARGRVLFRASVTGGSLPASDHMRTFRWDAGVITLMLPDDGFTHLLGKLNTYAVHRWDNSSVMTSDGRWIAERPGTLTATTREHIYHLTDGVTSSEVFRFVETRETRGDNPTDPDRIEKILPLASGGLIMQRKTIVYTARGAFGSGILPRITSEIAIVGPQPRIIATALTTSELSGFDEVFTGSEIKAFVADESGTAAYVIESYAGRYNEPTKVELIIHDASGPRVVHTVTAPPSDHRFVPVAVDQAGRVAITFEVSGTSFLTAGPDPVADRIVSDGDSIEGGVMHDIVLLGVIQPAGALDDRRAVLFQYNEPTGPRGIAIATRRVTRWVNASGGGWGDSANWLPAEIPSSATGVHFDLEASYDVSVGTRTAGRAAIENGSVAFRSPDLTLTGPFAIGGDASFTQPEGKITAGELTIGSLPPVNPAAEPTSRFFLSNKDTEFITTGPTMIGNAGRAELFISDAKMTSGEVRLGTGSMGTATIGLLNARWTTGPVAVGYSHKATLNIERGAHVESTSAVIGLGSELQNELATVNIDNANGPSPTQGVGNWVITGTLTLGDKLPARLNIVNGGMMGVGDPVRTALAKHDGTVDAAIEINGVGSTRDARSSMYFLLQCELGSGPNTLSDVWVLNGGLWHNGAGLILGEAPGSIGQVFVSGVNDSDLRAELEQGLTVDEPLRVGHRGEGILIIGDGGIVNAATVLVGGLAGGVGHVHVDGRSRNHDATLRATDFVVIGGSQLFGTVTGSPGTLTLQNNGRVESMHVMVMRNGTLRGTGTVVTELTVNVAGGTIEPGVGFDPPLADLEEIRPLAAAPAPILPGTLSFEGDVVLEPDARLVLDVTGSAPGAADRIVVDGALTLGGTLELHFTNGYAPRAGDTLDVVSATSVTGAFATTTVAGLAPGFQFTVAPIAGGGGVRLTAVNDAVPATSVGSRLANLSVRTPLALGQNLIVGFVVSGGAKPVLVRAAGPGLAQFVPGTHPDPSITLFDGEGFPVDANDSWPASLAPTMQVLGAFPFVEASADAALQRSAAAAYTAHVNGPGTGIVLVELYDAQAGVTPRLVNASARNHVGTGDAVLIAGFVVEGASPKTLLVRGVGPGLIQHGVDGVLADPQLTVFDDANEARAHNDDWPASLASSAALVGAFSLADGSKDAGLLITLAPGVYTAQVSGIGGTTGEALVEVYEVP